MFPLEWGCLAESFAHSSWFVSVVFGVRSAHGVGLRRVVRPDGDADAVVVRLVLSPSMLPSAVARCFMTLRVSTCFPWEINVGLCDIWLISHPSSENNTRFLKLSPQISSRP